MLNHPSYCALNKLIHMQHFFLPTWPLLLFRSNKKGTNFLGHPPPPPIPLDRPFKNLLLLLLLPQKQKTRLPSTPIPSNRRGKERMRRNNKKSSSSSSLFPHRRSAPSRSGDAERKEREEGFGRNGRRRISFLLALSFLLLHFITGGIGRICF